MSTSKRHLWDAKDTESYYTAVQCAGALAEVCGSTEMSDRMTHSIPASPSGESKPVPQVTKHVTRIGHIERVG